ncbi:MAG: hypothetical protein LBK08_02380 [Treponema sp.]|jgi:chromosome segregation ATPase|nr:hypothetical protein [Treponema sp.]
MKDEVVFDTASGISMDEQKEILAGINSAAGKNRLSLSAPEKPGKRGVFFPFAVNAVCILLLSGGVFFLLFVQEKEDLQIRQGRVVYNAAERALIREIRRETAERITEKEKEISLVVSRLEGVDTELQELQEAAGLEAETRREYLMQLQEEYHRRIDTLHDERTLILETSRAREEELRVQLEERAKELAAVSEESGAALAGTRAALTGARNELARLSGEQERLAVIEGQLAGLYAEVNARADNGDFAGAHDVLLGIKDFLETPAFQGIAAFRSRKEIYVRAAGALEAAMGRNGGNSPGAVLSPENPEEIITELRAENARLAESAAARNAEGSDLARRVSEYEESIQTLRALNSAREADIASREAAVAALQSRNAELAGTAAAQDAVIAELRVRGAEQAEAIENLNNQLASIRQALQALTQ